MISHYIKVLLRPIGLVSKRSYKSVSNNAENANIKTLFNELDILTAESQTLQVSYARSIL